MLKGHGVNDRACPAERLAAGRVGEGTVADVVPAFRRPRGCWGCWTAEESICQRLGGS